MKNKDLYDEYAVIGYPNIFFTFKAADIWNEHIEKICNKLPEGTKDFSLFRKIRLFLFRVWCLNIDIPLYIFENIKERKELK